MNILTQGQIKNTLGQGVGYIQISVLNSAGTALALVYLDDTLQTPTSAVFNTDQLGNYGPVYTANPPVIRATASGFVFADGTHDVAPVCLFDQFTLAAGVRTWDARAGIVVPLTGDYDFSKIAGIIDGTQLPAMSSTKKGAVPPTGTPSGLFLRDDATFASPGGGVASFNTRTGIVVSALNDYSFAQISGVLADSQLPADVATKNYALIMEYFF